MSVVRNDLTKGFAMIANQIITDTRVSTGARLLFCYLSSKPGNWQFWNNDMAKQLGIRDEKTVSKYLKELIEAEWIDRKRNIGEDGKFTGGYEYILKNPYHQKNHITKNTIYGENGGLSNIDLVNYTDYISSGTKKDSDELPDELPNNYPTSNEIATVKSISNKSTSIKKKEDFVPPTLEEVEAYCKERNNGVDAKRFFDYYNEGKWRDSQDKPVKNWKQKMIATWEKNSQSNVTPITPSKPQTERREPTEEELLEFRRKRLQEIAEWNERNKGR